MLSGRGSSGDDEFLFINLTPMIDIIMTLLVFFMTATKLADWEEHALDVSVPNVSSARSLSGPPNDIVISIDEGGVIRIKREIISISALPSLLTQARERYSSQTVVIQADGRTTHQNVADVMSACHAAKIEKVVHKVRVSTPAQ